VNRRRCIAARGLGTMLAAAGLACDRDARRIPCASRGQAPGSFSDEFRVERLVSYCLLHQRGFDRQLTRSAKSSPFATREPPAERGN